ncbi:spermidine synthase [Saccharopolyspora taberi]|uniref:Spermidine synthase n=1 Tax=Saccharopolyspora taberi TaxID=60895 RepID=A0ABN3VDU9_9PSEU
MARAGSPRGEVVLLRRDADDALELRVNGVFVMDTVHTETERLLATATLDAVLADDRPARVLIGGLGLGFTLREVVADRRVSSVEVVEIEPSIVEWHRAGLVGETAAALADERVRVSVGDVQDVLAAHPAACTDVLLLDVDNGPGFLVHDSNAAVYRREFLALCREKIAPGGCLAIWSASGSPELNTALREVFGNCREIAVPVPLGTRTTTYHLFLAR